jgi:1,4-dihydroxy-2-naphthoyl-CoA hydrolase
MRSVTNRHLDGVRRDAHRHTSAVTDTPAGPPLDMPLDPEFTGPFVKHLGLEITKADGDRVVATWTARPDLHQPYGIVHGGVHCSVVETLASVGAALWIGDEGKVVGVSNTTDFYRAVREGTLTSTATPLHRGRSQQVWLVETLGEDGKVAARGQVRLQNLRD